MSYRPTLNLKPGTAVRAEVTPSRGRQRPSVAAQKAAKSHTNGEAKLAKKTPVKTSEKPLQGACSWLKQSPAWRKKQPLALGFDKQAVAEAPEALHRDIRKVISLRCRSFGYVRKLIRGGQRFDWSGEPAGEISAEHQSGAVKTLAGMKAAAKRRRP